MNIMNAIDNTISYAAIGAMIALAPLWAPLWCIGHTMYSSMKLLKNTRWQKAKASG